MPVDYTRRLTGKARSAPANRQLGRALAFVAGATNAGAFLAVHQYTSHMTGVVSSMADSLVLGDFGLAAAGLGALLSFVFGAGLSAVLVNFARRRHLHSQFALPLLLEAALLLLFGLLGARACRRQRAGPGGPARLGVRAAGRQRPLRPGLRRRLFPPPGTAPPTV